MAFSQHIFFYMKVFILAISLPFSPPGALMLLKGALLAAVAIEAKATVMKSKTFSIFTSVAVLSAQ